jgi:hypothetical protein
MSLEALFLYFLYGKFILIVRCLIVRCLAQIFHAKKTRNKEPIAYREIASSGAIQNLNE